MLVEDLGQMSYRDAWARQEAAHDLVVAGGEERLLLVEHPPVVTFGRRPGGERNLRASPERLAELGVDLVQSDRGGEVTFHGPGQIVVYPIVRLIDHRLSVGAYVRRLEDVVIATLAEFEIHATKDDSAIGVWVDDDGAAAKICALGVRIKKGVSLHGIALNVDIDLSYFDLIVPCGLVGRGVTSVRKILGGGGPGFGGVKDALVRHMISGLSNP